MSEYQPGDVAMVSAANQPHPYRAYYDGKTWREYGNGTFCVDEPLTIRPLVVLDLDRVTKGGYRNAPGGPAEYVIGTLRSDAPATGTRNAIANQIEAQTKPPRIPEPGEWGVVSACLTDEAQVENCKGPLAGTYVRSSQGMWRHADSGYGVTWNELHDPVLVREGVES